MLYHQGTVCLYYHLSSSESLGRYKSRSGKYKTPTQRLHVSSAEMYFLVHLNGSCQKARTDILRGSDQHVHAEPRGQTSTALALNTEDKWQTLLPTHQKMDECLVESSGYSISNIIWNFPFRNSTQYMLS